MGYGFWLGSFVGLALWGCAATSGFETGQYNPVIDGPESRGVRYETDRQACETQVKASPSNYAPNNVVRFRQCLLAKGYRLLS